MVSERKLKKWRKEALIFNMAIDSDDVPPTLIYAEKLKVANTRIVKMTQELLDQRLLNK